VLSRRPAGSPPAADRRGERGSVLLLFPAAALVMLVLAAIAVDLGLVHVRQRELWSLADAAANDAAGYGVDPLLLRTTGEVRIDPTRAASAAADATVASGVSGVRIAEVVVHPDGTEVTVALERESERVIGRALPGRATRSLRASATARLVGVDATPFAP
jgi:uncharacterized membrane protein